MARDVRKKAGKSRTATLPKVDPEVIGKRSNSIGALHSSKEAVNLGEIIGGRPHLDVEICHNPQDICANR
jgi:hypothetical protein